MSASMNMQVAVPNSIGDLPWAQVTSEVNAWRGACLQCFARAEAAVTDALLFLSGVGQRGAAVQLRHLTGQRLEDIAQAIGPGGPFAAEGGAAHEALASFRIYESLRAHLAHDVARIALERNGAWVVVFRHLSIRSRTAHRSTMALEQAGAAETLADLKRKAQQLDSALTSLRRVVEAAS